MSGLPPSPTLGHDTMFEFDVVTTLSITALLMTVLYFMQSYRSRCNLPPFPARPLPVFGNLLSMGRNPRSIISQWRKEYGDVFSLYLGQTMVIVLSGYDVIKDALVTHGDHLSDRPVIFIDLATNTVNQGVVFTSGQNWHSQRKISMAILRSLGIAKNVMAENILEEIRHYKECLLQTHGEAVDIEPLTNMAVANAICVLVEGNRRDYKDNSFCKVIEDLRFIICHMRSSNPLNFYPSLAKLPGDLFKGKEIARRMNNILDSFRLRYFDQKNFSQTNGEDYDCFVDAYLKEMSKKTKTDDTSDLDNDNLIKIIWELYGAGTETSSTTILWAILYLLHFPDVQKKIHREIDLEIGTDRLPSMHDKAKLPYLNATIMEVQRISSIVPLSVMRTASDTVSFRGYTIPKGANIAPNLDSVLWDPAIWGPDVHSFRPERHFDEQGKLVIRKEFIPFSIGRRICLGEGLAKMELFLFLASMLQTFSFQPAEPGMLPSMKEIFGLTAVPQRFKVRVVPRDT